MKRATTNALLMLLLAGVTGAAHAGCWTSAEKAMYANDELDNVVTLSFRNALNCQPVAGATVLIGDQEVKTDAHGLIRFPAPEGVDDATIPIKVSAPGYQTGRGYLPIAFNLPLQNKFLLSPKLTTDKARFVLTWGEKPKDLDLHLMGPGFHVSYQDMRNVPNEARLDRDAMNGFGPETISANRVRSDASYAVWVHNYTGSTPIDRSAQVQFYLSDGTAEAVVLPATSARWIKVADIVGGQLKINVQPSSAGPGR